MDRLMQLPNFLTVEEVAKILRLKRSTAYDLVRRGEIPSIRLGRFVRVSREWLVAQETATIGAKR